MIHAKLMTVDGLWNVVGSTNFDHRSFALNDEVNLAVLDRSLRRPSKAIFLTIWSRAASSLCPTLGENALLAEDESVD